MPIAAVALDGCCFVGSRTGIANYVATLLEPLCALQPDVRFVLYCNDAGSFPQAPNLAVRISTPKRRGPVWHHTQVLQMLREDAIDVFWGTNGLVPLRGLGTTATVLTIHDLVHVFARRTQDVAKRWKQRVFQPRCARAADRVIAVSQATAEDVARRYGRVPDCVIHPLAGRDFAPADAAAAEQTLRRLALPAKFILTVGTLEPRKNIAALVEAHAACIAAGHDVPPLVIVGGAGWRDGEVRAALHDSAASGRVRHLGFLPNAELRHLYARCHAFVMPSIYEGFGMPLLEAQLCGAPVLHGSHPSMREAAGGLGVAFEASADGLRSMLAGLAEGRLALACRLPAAIENDADRSARRLWQVMQDAWHARRGSDDRCRALA
jgi:glycosyltransferase involved in cell wall biosynthesis